MGWYNEKKMTDQYAVEKRWVSSFDLKEESEDKYQTETVRAQKRVQDHRHNVLNGSLPQGPHPRNTERSKYLRLSEESVDETTQRGMELYSHFQFY